MKSRFAMRKANLTMGKKYNNDTNSCIASEPIADYAMAKHVQITVNIEDASMLKDIKQAIRMIKGVVSIENNSASCTARKKTLKAIESVRKGEDITKCNSFEDYLKAVE